MIININFKKLIKNLFIPLCVGLLSSFLIRNGVNYFNDNVVKPSFSPSPWLFPIAWTILYILMGIASYITEINNKQNNNLPFIFYFIQLGLNFIWPIIFFIFKWYLVSVVIIVLLLAFSILTTIEFYKVNKQAGYLLIPYILWLLFATVLNVSVLLLN